MKDAQIDEVMWRRAAELAATPDGLVIEGFGTVRGGRFEHRPESKPPTGYDAPKLVVKVADELGVKDDVVRARLRAELAQAMASAAGRPAPLGSLGLIEMRNGGVSFAPSRRPGASAAPADAIETVLTAWRVPADTLAERVAALLPALGAITGALSAPDARRLLDELDYDLDDNGWERFGAAIAAALPF